MKNLFNKENQYCLVFVVLLIIVGTMGLTSCSTRRSAKLAPYDQLYSPVGKRYLQRPNKEEVDSLIAIYGVNKHLIDKYKDIFIVALSYYPELKDVKIKFEYSNEKTTMASRPSSLFSPRTYKILVNSGKNFDGVPLDSIPYNAAIGVVGHELAHIVDYERLSFWGILDRLFLYLNKSEGKPYFEKKIDVNTIDRGLGWQLYDWAKYVMYDNTIASDKYKEFKRRTYLTPKEIEMYIKHYSKYKSEEE